MSHPGITSAAQAHEYNSFNNIDISAAANNYFADHVQVHLNIMKPPSDYIPSVLSLTLEHMYFLIQELVLLLQPQFINRTCTH